MVWLGDVAIAGQAGATAPVTLAGTLVQSLAETIACLMVVGFVRPGCPMMFGAWPLVSDLRTGSFTGGSGEQALLMAAVAQMANFYSLPGSVAAGMTDAKLPDNQAGFEKGVTTTIVALAGGNFVSECAGMLASLIGVSYEALVIDNDMLGSVMRTLRGIEVNEETLSVEVMREVAAGAGHYLGHAETLEKMESEYLYPRHRRPAQPGSLARSRGTRHPRGGAPTRARDTVAALSEPISIPASMRRSGHAIRSGCAPTICAAAGGGEGLLKRRGGLAMAHHIDHRAADRPAASRWLRASRRARSPARRR